LLDELKRVSDDMLNEWAETKQAPKHAEWLHNGEDFEAFLERNRG